jgi:SAM-dependent methyltransferase
MLSTQDWHRRFLQQSHWTKDLRNYLFDQIKIIEAHNVLEAGCGTGVITADLHLATNANIFGLDLQFERLELAHQIDPPSQFGCGNVFALPYASGAFDVVVCHYLLLWLKDAWLGLDEMRRVTRPGGVIAAIAEPDYGGRIDYPGGLSELGHLQEVSLRKQGADPYLGRKLAGLFVDAGLINVQTGILGGHWSKPPTPEEWQSEWDVIAEDLADLISPEDLAALRSFDAGAWSKGERILFVPTFYAWGFVP